MVGGQTVDLSNCSASRKCEVYLSSWEVSHAIETCLKFDDLQYGLPACRELSSIIVNTGKSNPKRLDFVSVY